MSGNSDPAVSAMIERINSERALRGLPALRPNDQLATAAQGHAEDMAAHRGMVHIGSDGSDGGDRIRAAGYDWVQWGIARAAAYLPRGTLSDSATVRAIGE